MIKLALFTVSYSGFFYKGDALSLEKQIDKAKELGFEGISIETRRPVALPCDLNKTERNRIKEYSESKNVKIAAIETMSNFASHIIEQRENNLCMVKDAIELAADLGTNTVKVFAAWRGTSRYNGLGTYEFGRRLAYINSYFVTEDQMWRWTVEGMRDCSRWANEKGIVIALQNHPPVVDYGYEDVLQMANEIDRDNVKLCLDVPLFKNQSDEYIHTAIEACRDVGIVHSHYGSPQFDQLPSGEILLKPDPYIGNLQINYPAFIRELKRIGYNGFIASEECAPVLENHIYQGIEVAERHVKAGLKYMKTLIAKGKEPDVIKC